jgi:hypothetical protein
VKIKIYKTIIVLVLYGCGTWSLALNDEHGCRMFDKRLLRRIFGYMIDEVTRGLRNLHNLYSSRIMMIKSRRII